MPRTYNEDEEVIQECTHEIRHQERPKLLQCAKDRGLPYKRLLARYHGRPLKARLVLGALPCFSSQRTERYKTVIPTRTTSHLPITTIASIRLRKAKRRRIIQLPQLTYSHPRVHESFRLEGCGYAQASTESGEIDEVEEAKHEQCNLASLARYYQEQGVLDISDTVNSNGQLPVVARTTLSSTPWDRIFGDGRQDGLSPSLDLRQSYLSEQQIPFDIRRTYDIDACILPLHSLGAFRTPF